jgi:hypothetical protein
VAAAQVEIDMAMNFELRDSLSPDEFYERFYASSGLERELVVELLTHLAQELRIPIEKIRPEDRFAVELAPRKGDDWDWGYGLLLYELKSMARRKKKVVSHKIGTVDDYLRAVEEVY